MNIDIIKKSVGLMLINFSINLGYDRNDAEEKLNAYCSLVNSMLSRNDVDEDMFQRSVAMFIEKTSGSNYNKLPSVGDLLDVLGLKPKDAVKLAEEQCELVFSSIQDMNRLKHCMFGDRVTNHVLSTYSGGLRAMVWDFDESNRNKKEVTWGRKDFKDRYIAAYDLKLSSTAPHKLKGLSGWANFGDEAKCLENALIHKANINVIQSRKETPQVGITIKRNK